MLNVNHEDVCILLLMPSHRTPHQQSIVSRAIIARQATRMVQVPPAAIVMTYQVRLHYVLLYIVKHTAQYTYNTTYYATSHQWSYPVVLYYTYLFYLYSHCQRIRSLLIYNLVASLIFMIIVIYLIFNLQFIVM